MCIGPRFNTASVNPTFNNESEEFETFRRQSYEFEFCQSEFQIHRIDAVNAVVGLQYSRPRAHSMSRLLTHEL